MPTSATAAYADRRPLLDSPLLPWGLAALGLVSVFAGPLGEAVRSLRLPDTDDAMRLAEVRDLVAGQSWFDMVQHRFLPPAGVASHWSRLLDAPLAAGIAGLTHLVGAPLAERLTTAVWPPLLFAVYAAVLMGGMVPLFGRRAGAFALFAATQTVGLVLQFAPGRIDHHNVQIVLMLGIGLCLMRRPSRRAAALAGVLCAFSLAIGLEALPLVALAGLVVAADWIRFGRGALPALLGFGMASWLAAVALFGLQTAPALWSENACDALSPPWLWLAGTGPMLGLAATVLRPDRLGTRLALVSALGALGLAGFALMFPACLHGPFPGMPESVRLNWLDRVREMQPLWAMMRDRPGEGLAFAACLFVAAVVALVLARREVERRRAFTVAGLFLAAGCVLTVFQMRGIYVASAFVPLVAGVCLDRALAASESALRDPRARLAFLAAAVALNAQAWLVAGRAIEYAFGLGKADTAGVERLESCSSAAGLAALDALPAGTVLASIDLGPYLLVHTRHAVVAAPYHRATAGLLAGLAVTAGDERALRDQAGRTGATYLAVCPNPAVAADQAADRSFAARLADGQADGQADASWLEALAVRGAGLKVWRIR